MKDLDFNKPLFEMAKKDTSYRTVDDKTWLSISSTISKNKADNAESVKPMSKLTVEDLVNRYAAALIIAKKGCPRTKDEIENIGTFKLYAYKALDLGATIADIKHAYDINSGNIPNDDIDPNDEILNSVINDPIENKNDDIDPQNKILNNIIRNDIKNISNDEFDEDRVKNFLSKIPQYNNTIDCPIKREDYETTDDFVNALNEYINSISGYELSPSDNAQQNKALKKQFEFGKLISINGLSDDEKSLYITMDLSDDDIHHDSFIIRPMNNDMFRNFNIWTIKRGKYMLNITPNYVGTKLAMIFNDNGYNIRKIYVNYDFDENDNWNIDSINSFLK